MKNGYNELKLLEAYCDKYPDVRRSNLTPQQHYDKYAKILGRCIDGIESTLQLSKSKGDQEDFSTKMQVFSEEVFVGIAAIPEREQALKLTVASLLPQVDQMGVYLNAWSYIPDFLRDPKIIVQRSQDTGDKGDVGKFYWVEDADGYYFTCDDDLVYPADYICRLVSAVKRYNYQAVVGWHGALIKEPFKDYYSVESRRVFTFGSHRPHDTDVHILGTGCMAFHKKTISPKLTDFPSANMADVYFAVKGQELKIPFVVVKHEQGEIYAVENTKECSIYSHSSSASESKKNTIIKQNEMVNSIGSWKLFDKNVLTIGLWGRFNGYKKGGIHKSCKLISEMLANVGYTVLEFDTDDPIAEVSPMDLAWIYPGDPNRPDWETVDDKIESLRELGIPVMVNFSYLYKESRSKWIASELVRYNSNADKPPVLAVTFTESAAYDPIFNSVRDYIVAVPKTIAPPENQKTYSYDEREGICIGDSAKLLNRDIIGGGSAAWIDAIRKRLPHVNIYAYKQYSGKNPHKHVKYAPYMKEEFGDWLGARRLFICLNVHLTFEMVACESQRSGTPVVYRHMPHSLSEYISISGVSVRTPEEMAEMVAWLYNDEDAWKQYSEASFHNSRAIGVEVSEAALKGAMKLAMFRVRNLKTSL